MFFGSTYGIAKKRLCSPEKRGRDKLYPSYCPKLYVEWLFDNAERNRFNLDRYYRYGRGNWLGCGSIWVGWLSCADQKQSNENHKE